jgi:hypothetical protein
MPAFSVGLPQWYLQPTSSDNARLCIEISKEFIPETTEITQNYLGRFVVNSCGIDDNY